MVEDTRKVLRTKTKKKKIVPQIGIQIYNTRHQQFTNMKKRETFILQVFSAADIGTYYFFSITVTFSIVFYTTLALAFCRVELFFDSLSLSLFFSLFSVPTSCFFFFSFLSV